MTPCRNAENCIGETIESVLAQTALRGHAVELEYIICDGASEDATTRVVESFRSPHVRFLSAPDGGMYDALSKGLAQTTGDVVSYLNAGDLYNPHAFEVAKALFKEPEVSWLTGLSVRVNQASQVVHVSVPFRYRPRLLQKGFYGPSLPFVQQESTFWRRALSAEVDLERLATFRYAGDYYLWVQFSKRCELHIAETHLGSFRVHQGQLSENRRAYLAEVRTFTNRPTVFDYALGALDRLAWFAPPPLKARWNPRFFHRFSHDNQDWR